jgi:hypothetical protein
VTVGSNWGATAQECALPLACDALLAGTPVRMNRAISVFAPASVVFRWLCQLKLAPYSYDLLDNFARQSPRELVDGVEQLEVGQRFMSIFSLVSFAANEHLTLRGRRVAVTYMVLGERERTRLVARVLFNPPAGRIGGALLGPLLSLGDQVMMRKQLLTLKALAEKDAIRTHPRDGSVP